MTKTSSSSPRGACQICARPIGIKTGVIAHHGYQRPQHQGYQTSSCEGAKHLPYELSCDAIDEAIQRRLHYIEHCTAKIPELMAAPPAELVRHDAGLTAEQRDGAVDDFIELVGAVDGILQAQAKADANYFAAACGRAVVEAEAQVIEAAFLRAYRWQYIFSGAAEPRFQKVLRSMITEDQLERIEKALAPIAASATRRPAPYRLPACAASSRGRR